MRPIFSDHTISLVKTWGLFIFQVSLLVFYQWLFYRLTDGTAVFTKGLGLMFAFGILCVLVFSFFHRQWPFSVFLFLFTVQLYANILYYRTYYAFIPFSSYFIAGNLKEFDKAVFMLMKGKDILFFLPFFLYLPISRFIIKRGIKYPGFPKKLRVSAVSLLLSAGISLLLLKSSGIGQKFHYEKIEATQESCFPVYFGVSVCEYLIHKQIVLTPEERNKIRSFISGPQITRTPVKKNLILILIESLESWPLLNEINGQPVTPFLNSLLRDTCSWYTPYLLPQTRDGGSIDAQLILNTGLLPPRSGAFAFLYENNTYPSLSKILKKNGYANSTLYQACPPGMWNQVKVNKAFGTDGFKDASQYIRTDLISNFVSDSSFMDQTARMMTHLPHPFYAQLVTQSSHSPFYLPNSKKRLSIPEGMYNETFANYLQSIAYVDASLENFFRKLKENGIYEQSVFILTGDHCTSYGTGKLSDWLEPYRDLFHIKGNFVPLIIINGGINGISGQVAAQIDVFPTLLDLLGINSRWNGLGNSLFAPGRTPSACSVTGTPDNTEYDYYKEMAEISDLIIRGNYFKNTTVSKLPTDTGIITNIFIPD